MRNDFMAEIIVSSLGGSGAAFAEHKPSHVISILDYDEPTPPAFDVLDPSHHLKVIENCSRGAASCIETKGAERCGRLIEFARDWAGGGPDRAPLLIHCHQGVARSMAAAYIIMCAVEGGACEHMLARRLRDAAPHADPNILLISEADALLDRKDRMVEAMLDLCPCTRAVASPIVILPVAV